MTKDHLAEIGDIALASRLRRLLFRLHGEGVRIYEDLGLDFKPKWFPVFRLIATRSGITAGQLAEALQMAHPSVIEIVQDLARHGLVASARAADDRRKRELRLTRKGRRRLDSLEPVWEAFAAVGREICTESDNDFLAAIAKVERALERRSFRDRLISHLGG
jgi:DNA-binding MarR family transcriptional regulator